MEPRYQCIAVGPVWAWRLLGSNHRELARSAARFTALDEAVVDAVAVAAQAATATFEITVGAGATWQWVMTVDDVYRARSSVGYARRLECVRAFERFRTNAPLAQLSPTPLRRRRPSGRPATGPVSRPVPGPVPGPEWRDEALPVLRRRNTHPC
jgi:hypothetical protein